jgi:outer membrane protein insertion porin family
MHNRKKTARILCALFLCILQVLTTFSVVASEKNGTTINKAISREDKYQDSSLSLENENDNFLELDDSKIINAIFITGNHLVAEETIRAKLPYKKGGYFKKNLSSLALSNLFKLGYFTLPITIETESISETAVNIHIKVTEKLKLSNVEFKGNKNLSAEDIEKKIKFSEISAIDQEGLLRYAQALKKMYREKNLHFVEIESELRDNGNGTVTAVFTIAEGRKSVVKRVFFKGNKSISSRLLRGLIFTREDWILSILDKAGTYHPDALESDKYTIENYYQSNGYLTARVTDTVVERNPESNAFSITFVIDEGPLYRITKIEAPGNELVTQEALLSRIPIKEGCLYSRDEIRRSLDIIKLIWGEFGYIYADVEPEVHPDHGRKEVQIRFKSELGNKVTLNRISIRGNRKTQDSVIRRRISLDEGETITTLKMDDSKALVSSLGYFDQRDGVNWRIVRLDDNLADLELILQEIKTGKMYAQATYGGVDKSNPSIISKLKFGIGLADRNLLGTGISYDFQASYSAQESNLGLVISNPWLFDRPLLGAVSGFYKNAVYENIKNVQSIPTESTKGLILTTGARIQTMNDVQINYDFGLQDVNYKEKPLVSFNRPMPAGTEALYQFILNRQFQAGGLAWLSQNISQDTRNNPSFPTRGSFWSLLSKAATGASSSHFGFFRLDFDCVWYTPLIGEFDLVFAFHTHAGVVQPFNHRTVPYRELYHIGGPTTVRGYVPGDLGPSLAGDSIGATRAFYVNTELVFPFTKDMGTKGRIFYDGGSGWGYLGESAIDKSLIRNYNFNYRHAIGFGFQMVRPQPLRIDIGWKLDRDRRLNESAYEVAFSMAQDFW